MTFNLCVSCSPLLVRSCDHTDNLLIPTGTVNNTTDLSLKNIYKVWDIFDLDRSGSVCFDEVSLYG